MATRFAGVFSKILRYLYGEKPLPAGKGVLIFTSQNPTPGVLQDTPQNKPENPESLTPDIKPVYESEQKELKDYNISAWDELLQYLSVSGLPFWVQKGSYGKPENSVVVLGVSEKEAQQLAAWFEQESVVWAGRNGQHMLYKMIGQNGEISDLTKTDVELIVGEAIPLEDFYSGVGRKNKDLRKYSIPYFGRPSGGPPIPRKINKSTGT